MNGFTVENGSDGLSTAVHLRAGQHPHCVLACVDAAIYWTLTVRTRVTYLTGDT